MTTSALSLYQLLAATKKHRPDTDKFITVLANHLELKSADAEAKALGLILNLLQKADLDIGQLPVDDGMKSHLRRHLVPFDGLKNFTQIHQSFAHAQKSFLDPKNLNGLTDLHLALTGHVETKPISKDATEIAKKFRALSDELIDAEIPPDVKFVLKKRTDQIASILEHYYAFGAQSLKEELEGLVGAIVTNPPAKGAKSIPYFKTLIGLVSAGFVILAEVDDATDNVISLAEKVGGFLEFVDDDTPSEVDFDKHIIDLSAETEA